MVSPSCCPSPLPLPNTCTPSSRTSLMDTAGQCAPSVQPSPASFAQPCPEFPSFLCDAGMAIAFAFPGICHLLPPKNHWRLQNRASGSLLRIHSPSGLTDQPHRLGRHREASPITVSPAMTSPSTTPRAASSPTSSALPHQDPALGANHHHNLLPPIQTDPVPSLHCSSPSPL